MARYTRSRPAARRAAPRKVAARRPARSTRSVGRGRTTRARSVGGGVLKLVIETRSAPPVEVGPTVAGPDGHPMVLQVAKKRRF